MSYTNYLLTAIVVLLSLILVVLVDIAYKLRNENQQHDVLGEVVGCVRELVNAVIAAVFLRGPGL